MKLETDSGEGIAQKILEAFFVQLHEQEAIQKLVILHTYLHVYQLDLAKMAGMFRPLNKIQKVNCGISPSLPPPPFLTHTLSLSLTLCLSLLCILLALYVHVHVHVYISSTIIIYTGFLLFSASQGVQESPPCLVPASLLSLSPILGSCQGQPWHLGHSRAPGYLCHRDPVQCSGWLHLPS